MIDWIRCAAFAGVILYAAFDYFDGRQVKDEREELIQLKSLNFAHKATTFALFALALGYIFLHEINVQFVILAMIVASLYSEIAAKFYYRRVL